MGEIEREPPDRRSERGMRQHLFPVFLHLSLFPDFLLRARAHLLHDLLAVCRLSAVVFQRAVSPDGHPSALILYAVRCQQPRAQSRLGVLSRERAHLHHHPDGDLRGGIRRADGLRCAERRSKADFSQAHDRLIFWAGSAIGNTISVLPRSALWRSCPSACSTSCSLS